MQKNVQIIFLVFLHLLINSCRPQEHKVVLSNNSDCIAIITDTTVAYFQKRTIIPNIFQIKPDTEIYCSNKSTEIGCYDRNRQDYQMCTKVKQISNETRIITSSDSCTRNNLSLNDSLFHKINFNGVYSAWDSIRIQSESDEYSIDSTYRRKVLTKIRAKNHPLTVEEEVFLMCTTNIQLYYLETHHDYPIKIDIYSQGKVTKHLEGNWIPILYQSLAQLIYKPNQ